MQSSLTDAIITTNANIINECIITTGTIITTRSNHRHCEEGKARRSNPSCINKYWIASSSNATRALLAMTKKETRPFMMTKETHSFMMTYATLVPIMERSISRLQRNVSLKPYHTFGIDVIANYFISIHTPQLINELHHHPLWQQPIDRLILGGGSNCLFTQNYPGLILHNQIKGIETLHEDTHHITLRIGGGETWHDLVEYCVNREYAGIENLSLIPGTVGAAPIQNIGAYGCEIKDTLLSVDTIHLNTGQRKQFKQSACHFSYRDSFFKRPEGREYFITHVTLKLSKQPQFNLSYPALRQYLMPENQPSESIDLRKISQAVIHIRQQKLPDPKQLGNAGSFFKNPVISTENYHALQQRFPKLPAYPTSSNTVKVPAAWLIEHCGFKGERFGDVGVYPKQALVLCNYGTATGYDVMAIATRIIDRVYATFAISLTPEVNIF